MGTMSVIRTRSLVSQVRAVSQLSSAISIRAGKNSQIVHLAVQDTGVIRQDKTNEEVQEKTSLELGILQPLPAKRLEPGMTLKPTISSCVLEQRNLKGRQ